MNEIEAYVRQSAIAHGVDPNVAVRVALSEGGLKNPFRRAEGPVPRTQAPGLGSTENAFGPLQLYVSGTGAGLGDRAVAAGIDPTKDWKGGVDFALNEASQKGWGQWYGAKRVGIGNMQGIGGRPDVPPPQPAQPPVMDGTKGDEALVPAGYSTRPQGPVEAAGGGRGSDPRGVLASLFSDRPGGPVEAAGGGAGNETGAGIAAPTAAPVSAGQAFWDKFSKNLTKLGGAMAGGGAPQRPAPVPGEPAAVRIDQGDVPTIDASQQDQQRQMLALAMQRLNSGRLF